MVTVASFDRMAVGASRLAGRPEVFWGTVVLMILWGISGPFFGYSDTWQLVANTSTTLATTLLVLLVQATQTRDAAALQLKLDALIAANQAIDNRLLAIEKQPLSEIAREAEALRQS